MHLNIEPVFSVWRWNMNSTERMTRLQCGEIWVIVIIIIIVSVSLDQCNKHSTGASARWVALVEDHHPKCVFTSVYCCVIQRPSNPQHRESSSPFLQTIVELLMISNVFHCTGRNIYFFQGAFLNLWLINYYYIINKLKHAVVWSDSRRSTRFIWLNASYWIISKIFQV